MKTTQKRAILGLLFMLMQVGFSQVYKFKASGFSIIEKNQEGKWGEWSEFENSSLIITLDGKKDRVVVASQEIQLYKIVSYGQKISTVFDDTIALNCTDNAGGSCTILIVTRKNQNNRKQFYINYEDVKIVYNVYEAL